MWKGEIKGTLTTGKSEVLPSTGGRMISEVNWRVGPVGIPETRLSWDSPLMSETKSMNRLDSRCGVSVQSLTSFATAGASTWHWLQSESQVWDRC